MLLSRVLERLWMVNIALNALGLWKAVRYQRKRHAVLRKPPPSTVAPAEVIAHQALLIEALREQCQQYRELSQAQRQYMLRKHPASDCKRCRKVAQKAGRVASAPEDLQICPICWHNDRDMAFQCGHVTCQRCSLIVTECPLCRVPIQQRLKLFM